MNHPKVPKSLSRRLLALYVVVDTITFYMVYARVLSMNTGESIHVLPVNGNCDSKMACEVVSFVTCVVLVCVTARVCHGHRVRETKIEVKRTGTRLGSALGHGRGKKSGEPLIKMLCPVPNNFAYTHFICFYCTY